MKTLWVVLSIIVFGLSEGFSIATASFISDNDQKLQLIINGKLINHEPKKLVKVKSKPGNHELVIKVYDASGCLAYTYHNYFFATSGFQSYFKFLIRPENCTELRRIKLSRIYSERMRRPDDFYNRRWTSSAYGFEYYLPMPPLLSAT